MGAIQIISYTGAPLSGTRYRELEPVILGFSYVDSIVWTLSTKDDNLTDQSDFTTDGYNAQIQFVPQNNPVPTITRRSDIPGPNQAIYPVTVGGVNTNQLLFRQTVAQSDAAEWQDSSYTWTFTLEKGGSTYLVATGTILSHVLGGGPSETDPDAQGTLLQGTETQGVILRQGEHQNLNQIDLGAIWVDFVDAQVPDTVIDHEIRIYMNGSLYTGTGAIHASNGPVQFSIDGSLSRQVPPGVGSYEVAITGYNNGVDPGDERFKKDFIVLKGTYTSLSRRDIAVLGGSPVVTVT